MRFYSVTFNILGLRKPSVKLKPGECFPNLLKTPSYLEKNEYVRPKILYRVPLYNIFGQTNIE